MNEQYYFIFDEAGKVDQEGFEYLKDARERLKELVESDHDFIGRVFIVKVEGEYSNFVLGNERYVDGRGTPIKD
jgi:hypothetical protein